MNQSINEAINRSTNQQTNHSSLQTESTKTIFANLLNASENSLFYTLCTLHYMHGLDKMCFLPFFMHICNKLTDQNAIRVDGSSILTVGDF